ncbi:MAG: hypothetical protein HC905_06380 [Bacteroidales bacterium]|nr:hypothetical protein [Bacteroidales bacterium]
MAIPDYPKHTFGTNNMKNSLILTVLIFILMTSCKREVILSEDQIPDDIFYQDKQTTPFTGKCLIYYYKTNQVHYVFNYSEGVLNGSYLCYYKSGSIQYEGNYQNGELNGEFKRYNENGK